MTETTINGADRNNDVKNEDDLQQEIQALTRQLEELSRAKNDDFANAHGSADGNECSRIDAPPGRSGYLFKWQDRSIGWGGTKWGLRFVRLDHGQLSYYKSHEESHPRYILTLKNCAVRDDGSKINKRHRSAAGASGNPGGGSTEVGSHFYVFSIYQRPIEAINTPALNDKATIDHDKSTHGSNDERNGAQQDKEEDIVPLLRFSTQSLAEKTQWIDLISQACAYCDSDDFRIFQRRLQQQHQQTSNGDNFYPHKAEKGTLPALYFEPPPPLPRYYANKQFPSGHRLDQIGKLHRKKSFAKDAARSNKISYPPSKPMHRQSGPSYLSSDAGGNKQNYRGLFNLLIIILVVSNFRLLLDTVRHHGFILKNIHSLRTFWDAPLADFPFFSGVLIVQIFVVGAYVIEKLLSRGYWTDHNIGMTLHIINANATLVTVMAIVWYLIENPVVGVILIMHATITWLKLLSYVHANYDYRATTSSPLDKHQATVALVKDLDEKGLAISYPHNVTLANIYYFWLAPTLTYQIAYPRTPTVRWMKVATLSLHLFVSVTLMVFLGAQVIAPNLDTLLKDLEKNRGEVASHVVGDYLLKLSITSTYVWLLGFYAFFHCFLNLSAELLRFGDRVFYRDWWNASEVSAYWRLWNMPVHYWLVRHVYFPSVRIGFSKKGATFMVFLLSAILHEVLISIPCHMIRAWSFIAMMGQIPLIILTKFIHKKIPGSSIGNVIFWISFCFVGQPMAMLLYTIDYREINQQHTLNDGVGGMKQIDGIGSYREGNKTSSFPFEAIGRFFGASPEL